MYNDISSADTYFTTRMGAEAGWAALTTAEKTSRLTTAYNRLKYSGAFTLPDSPTAIQLTVLRIAECEFAWYMHIHLIDEDKRLGLQAQNVEEADIVGETYNEELINNLPIPAIIKKMLKSYSNSKPFYASDIDRDENESVNTEVGQFT